MSLFCSCPRCRAARSATRRDLAGAGRPRSTILTESERERVRGALRIHGQAMLNRLERRDFLNYSAYSHDGRLPGYLVEFSIVLAEEEVAASWLDYGLRALMTVFPHWVGQDGGWARVCG